MSLEQISNLKKKEAIAPYTTFQIGGRAAWLVQVEDPIDLIAAVQIAKNEKIKYCVIAGGSNVLFPNKPYSGLVVVYRKKDCLLPDLVIGRKKIICPASIYLDKFIQLATEQGWAGLEKLSWIPGTVGGSVFGNAGAYGQSIGEMVDSVEIFDGKVRRWISGQECRFGYRESIFKKKSWLVLNVAFKRHQVTNPKLVSLKESRAKVISDRQKKFYEDIKCPGSFFKNVLAKKVSKKSLKLVDPAKIIDGKIPAGYLLETVGSKGMRVGGVYVADFHGNLILNDGTATYAQVEKLAAKLKKLVNNRFGIQLEKEVRVMV